LIDGFHLQVDTNAITENNLQISARIFAGQISADLVLLGALQGEIKAKHLKVKARS